MCVYCNGTGQAPRVSECGSHLVRVNCPQCVLGVTIRGTHEMLRPRRTITAQVGDSPFIEPDALYAYFIKSPDGAHQKAVD